MRVLAQYDFDAAIPILANSLGYFHLGTSAIRIILS